MVKKSIYLTIGGEAGDGILSAGEILCKIFFEAGAGLTTYKDFPSRIRGGHTSYSIRVADDYCDCVVGGIDILIAFDAESLSIYKDRMNEGGVVIYDSSRIKDFDGKGSPGAVYYAAAPGEIAAQKFSKPVYKNAIMIGFISAMLDIPDKCVEAGFLKSVGHKKGDEALRVNMEACRYGADCYRNEIRGKKFEMPRAELKNPLMMTGNEAVFLGALTAGCKFIAAYPISPATEIFEMMCSELPKHGGTTFQAEDEIAALCAAIGAGFGGARAMTSTSGPGLSLMSEAIGLAGCAEVPVVIVDAQRPGPSTGLPTKTEQGDLYHALFSSHGDSPRIVLAAGNLRQCFEFTVKAFNLAEIFQCPVILLSEQALSQNKTVAPEFDFSKISIDRGRLMSEAELTEPGYKFLRYEYSENGISPRAVPSQKGGIHIANGNEHLDTGRITEDRRARAMISDKRMKKIETAATSKYLPAPEYYGDRHAKYGIMTIGCNMGAVVEAVEILKSSGGPLFEIMQLTALLPFPEKQALEFAGRHEKIFIVENNVSGQLGNIVKMRIPIHEKIAPVLKYDGSAFTAAEIAEKLAEVE